MKKGSTLPLILAACMIILLLGLAGFVTFLYRMDDDAPVRGPETAVSIATETETDEEGQVITPGHAIVSADEDGIPEHSYIFVGDSRTVGMRDALALAGGDPCTFIAKSGEGFYWLSHEGIDELQVKLAEEPYATVIFNLGVNDLKEYEQYIGFYQELFSGYHDPTFYIMSVNPVNDEKCVGASNEEVHAFNDAMKDAFPEKYLDTCTYLEEDGFESADGLHYSNDTYKKLHQYVAETIASLNP